MPRSRYWFALLALFAIELLDEFIYGAREAAWPQIRDDLSLSYAEVGLLLSIPSIVGNLIEPGIGLLGSTPQRRRFLVLAGGLSVALSLVLYALSSSFWVLLLGASLCSPASGAFVGLSQASLMDAAPEEREKNMARWTLAGYIGVAAGPLALSALVFLGSSWRGFFAVSACITLALVGVVWRNPLPIPQEDEAPKEGVWEALKKSFQNKEVMRYVILLELADLMMDVLFGFLALYLVDVSLLSEAEAGIGVAVWTVSALIGDALFVVFLERFNSTRYLRISALVCAALFVAFQLAQGLWVVMVLLALLGVSRAGWYSLLKARLYAALPGHSGVVLVLTNVFNFASALLPFGLGLLAEAYGLWWSLWLLLLGPISILLGLREGTQNKA